MSKRISKSKSSFTGNKLKNKKRNKDLLTMMKQIHSIPPTTLNIEDSMDLDKYTAKWINGIISDAVKERSEMAVREALQNIAIILRGKVRAIRYSRKEWIRPWGKDVALYVDLGDDNKNTIFFDIEQGGIFTIDNRKEFIHRSEIIRSEEKQYFDGKNEV
jgi:hypothetical protein